MEAVGPDEIELSDLLVRRGRFTVSTAMLEEADMVPVLLRVMGEVVVVRCEHMFATRTFEYVAVSPSFDALEEGEDIPEYDLTFDADEDLVTWSRKPG